MIFGRSNKPSDQNQENGQGFQNASPGYAQGTAFPQNSAVNGLQSQWPQAAAGQQPSAEAYGTYPQGSGNLQGPYAGQPSGTGYAGYIPGTGNYPGIGAGYPSGYGQAGTGYGSASPYGTAPGTGTQNGYSYGYTGQSYTAPQQSGYAQQPYATPGSHTGGGTYIPQTPYSQGYASQGYGQSAQNSVYNGYPQMGRSPQQGTQSQEQRNYIPLNGGGYVPPPVPVRHAPFVFSDGLLILLSAVLLALFIVGLVAVKPLLWVFLALAVVSVAVFWVRPLIASNKRMCFTMIFAALALVAGLQAGGVFAGIPGTQQGPVQQSTEAPSPTAAAGQNVVIDPRTGEAVSTIDAPETTTLAPMTSDTAATDRLESFFYFWYVNNKDSMLTLCAPSWQSSVESPQKELFGILGTRIPIDYSLEKISGTVDDTTRTVTVASTIDRNNGKDPVKYRLNVIMVREGDQWYVDPQSLKTYEKAETTNPAVTVSPTPTVEPVVLPSTVLYYNPNGGKMYHLDPNCKSTHAKFLPFKGHFTYSQINEKPYSELEPCNVCGAPLR